MHAKAKGSPGYRFYALYDKVYRRDVLEFAYVRCRANGGAPGIDGQTFEDIEAYGRDRWLDELAAELRKRDVPTEPGASRFHPESGWQATAAGDRNDPRPRGADGGGAGLGADLRGRPGAGATRLPARPQRPGRRQASPRAVNTGHTEVVDADLSGYFDSIPHAELMKSVSRRISDRHLLGLIKMWLEAPVEEIDERGRTHRTTRNKDEGRGSPQGSPLSPLLANIYMRRFIVGWKALGHEQRLDAHIVNYADDFVICCRGTADEAMAVMRSMMSKLRLTVNETKTRLCRVPEETFDFLGYTIGRCYSPQTGQSYIGTKPSAKKIDRLKDEIRELTEPPMAVDGGRGPSGATEPDASGLVELLLPRPCQPGVSSH